MTAKKQQPASANELFDQAMKSFEQAIQYGLKVQTEAIQCWNELLKKSEVPADWKRKVEAVLNDAIPVVQKNTEETLALLESNRQASLALFNQALGAAQCQSPQEFSKKAQAIWQSGLNSIREHSEMLVKANNQAVDQWAKFVNKLATNA